jgi:hypothetical protein
MQARVDEFFIRLRPVNTTPFEIPFENSSITFKDPSTASKIYSVTFEVLSVAFKTSTTVFGTLSAAFKANPAIFNRLFQGAVHIVPGLCCKRMENVSILVCHSLWYQVLHDFIVWPSFSFEPQCLGVFLITVSFSTPPIHTYSSIHNLPRQTGYQC